jgi:hypothetical protein
MCSDIDVCQTCADHNRYVDSNGSCTCRFYPSEDPNEQIECGCPEGMEPICVNNNPTIRACEKAIPNQYYSITDENIPREEYCHHSCLDCLDD